MTTTAILDDDECRILDTLWGHLEPSLHKESRAILSRLIMQSAMARAVGDGAGDREEAATTFATAQAELARYQALVVEWRTATREHEAIKRGQVVDRAALWAACERMDAAEIALAKSVPEAAT